ncbi:MAG: hypothetical protein QW101_03745 [Ignisphaera sp.]|uniref:Phosphatidate cytidylyltransferase n=1 Tax=Ignisphaera aggregans TaxID=334771 RepID=A0A7J3N005_9CREN
MNIISRSFKTIYTSNILRKTIHLTLSLILIIPFSQPYREFMNTLLSYSLDPTLLTMVILLFTAAFINSLQIRVPNLRDRFIHVLGDIRKKFLSSLETVVKGNTDILENIDKMFSRYEERLIDIISSVERSYELRYGYICVTFALLSITISYVLFSHVAVYGILALGIVDALSSIISMSTQTRRKFLKHTDLSILTTFTIFTVLIYTLNWNIINSITLSFVAITVELLSPEDNLTLPIAVSLVAYVMDVPLPNI